MSHTQTNARDEPAQLLGESERHRVLAAPRRRTVLDVLAANPEPVSLDELAMTIVAHEDAASAVDHAEAAISLHHKHLPLMDATGLVDYAPETKEVHPNPDALDAARFPQ